ncbi:MAG: sulfite exporter TauE/SafE family protein [Thermomicrobiales bacterium]
MHQPVIQILLWAVVGVGVGAYGTLVGAGGGFVIVPIFLFFISGIKPAEAAGTSLSIVFFNALSGTASYVRQGRVDFWTGTRFALATVPGAIVGAYLSNLFSSRPFYIVFGLFLILIACFLSIRPDPRQADGESHVPAEALHLRRGWVARTVTDRSGETFSYIYSMWNGLALSFVVGFLSSILGIGGGIIHVPALVFLFGFPAHIATATSHYILVISSLVGSISHLVQGDIRWIPMIGLSIGVIPGAQFGAQLSSRLHGKWIIRGLALALAVVGLRLLLKT